MYIHTRHVLVQTCMEYYCTALYSVQETCIVKSWHKNACQMCNKFLEQTDLCKFPACVSGVLVTHHYVSKKELSLHRHYKSCSKSHGKERLKRKNLTQSRKTDSEGANVTFLGQTVWSMDSSNREGPTADGRQPCMTDIQRQWGSRYMWRAFSCCDECLHFIPNISFKCVTTFIFMPMYWQLVGWWKCEATLRREVSCECRRPGRTLHDWCRADVVYMLLAHTHCQQSLQTNDSLFIVPLLPKPNQHCYGFRLLSVLMNHCSCTLMFIRRSNEVKLHLRAMGCHCHMGSQHYLPSPDTSEHTPPQPQPEVGTRFTQHIPWMDKRLSWPRWPVTHRDGLLTHRWSPIQVLTQYYYYATWVVQCSNWLCFGCFPVLLNSFY